MVTHIVTLMLKLAVLRLSQTNLDIFPMANIWRMVLCLTSGLRCDKLRDGTTLPLAMLLLHRSVVCWWCDDFYPTSAGIVRKMNLSECPENEFFLLGLEKSCNTSMDSTQLNTRKVRQNGYYYRHYSFVMDMRMIFVTAVGKKIQCAERPFN